MREFQFFESIIEKENYSFLNYSNFNIKSEK
jgi:hypothetical protein